jgi:hypothetical protein
MHDRALMPNFNAIKWTGRMAPAHVMRHLNRGF